MAWIDLSLPVDDWDLFVRLVPFPPGKSHGVTAKNPDGTFSVYIDANAMPDRQRKAYWHEYEHIAYNDFDNGKPIAEVENLDRDPDR